MPTPVSSIVPATAATSMADAAMPGLVLQPGTVVDAKVLSVMADNLVRIAIANLAIDVMSEVALTPGQNLHLAVSRNEAGIRLAIVGVAGEAVLDTVMLTADAAAGADSPPLAPSANVARNQLTPLEQIAVSVASEQAVTRQGSQAPLFADLAAVIKGSDLPPILKQAVQDVLAQQAPLDSQLTGEDIESAFQKSGLFFEASLASGMTLPSGTVPDLKAALLVLRETLAAMQAMPESSGAPQPVVQQFVSALTTPPRPASPQQPPTTLLPQAAPGNFASPPLELEMGANPLPALQPDLGANPSAPALRNTDTAAAAVAMFATEAPTAVLPRTLASDLALSLLQEPTPDMPGLTGNPPAANKPALQDGRASEVATRPLAVPPPIRGALPSPQPIAPASLVPNAPLAATVHRLLEDADAAIARQTLLQIASLPDRPDAGGLRNDPPAPQWSFEIPFATAQGTAVAQFEISRDGGGTESGPDRRAWRARFSLNIEPTGPVHALITLNGDKTSVRMWAERPETAAQLRAGASELTEALTRAELKPGDIVIREGTPPQPAPAKAGHFLDRAL